MSTLETNLVQPSTGTTLTLGASGDTISIPSGATIANSGTATGFGGTNECRWFASVTNDQTISHNSLTKVAFANEVIDSDTAYDPSTNYRFKVPSGKGGTYKVEFGFWLADSASNLQQVEGYLYKNGVELFKLRSQHNATGEYAGYVNLSSIAVLSASDYLEVYVYIEEATSGSSEISGSGNDAKFRSFFSGYKLIT